MKFTLPMPPGINNTYGINGNVMYKRNVARDWEKEAGMIIVSQRARQALKQKLPYEGPVQVGISWFYKWDRDIDAGLKVVLDLLQKQRIYLDDRQVRRVTYIDIQKDKENPRVEIEVGNYEL